MSKNQERHRVFTEAASRRVLPPSGRALSVIDIRGSWRPSVSIDCAGVFAVCWNTTDGGERWAALHDFGIADQRTLLEQCAHVDQARHATRRGASKAVAAALARWLWKAEYTLTELRDSHCAFSRHWRAAACSAGVGLLDLVGRLFR
jgi:hypothetical protein